MPQGWGSPPWAACGHCPHHFATAPHTRTADSVVGQTHQRRNITPANFFAGLTEWAEQALLYIEDTNAHWLHNVRAVSASSWHRIDLDVDDWTEQVALHIADNYHADLCLVATLHWLGTT